MIAKEVKRRTREVHKDMDDVIVNGGPLSAVAGGVQHVGEIIAHSAALTEERFDAVEERLGGLELGQQNILEAVGGLTFRVGNLETAHVALRAEMGRMEARICGEIDKLGVRADKVFLLVIKDERKLAEILNEDAKDE